MSIPHDLLILFENYQPLLRQVILLLSIHEDPKDDIIILLQRNILSWVQFLPYLRKNT